MPQQEDVEEQLKLLSIYRQTLSVYLRQQAIHGAAFLPPSIAYGIRETRENIRLIETNLHRLGIDVKNDSNDEIELPLFETTTSPEQYQKRPFLPRLPRSNPDFLDREKQLRLIQAELHPGGGAWLHGPPGCGLSALLQAALNLPEVKALPDGAVYLDGEYEPDTLDGIIQRLFDLFFIPSPRISVTIETIRAALTPLQAVIVFDRLRLSYDELRMLTNILSKSAVLIAADEPAPETLRDIFIGSLHEKYAARLFINTTAPYLNYFHSELAEHFGPPDQVADAPSRELIALFNMCSFYRNLPLPLFLVGKLIQSGRDTFDAFAWETKMIALDDDGLNVEFIPPPQAPKNPLVHIAKRYLDLFGHENPTCVPLLIALTSDTVDRSTIADLAVKIKHSEAETVAAVQLLSALGVIKQNHDHVAIPWRSLRRAIAAISIETEQQPVAG